MTKSTRAAQSKAQQIRRDILLAATHLFAERGFTGVSVLQVATEADVFPNQVTYHFGGKSALFVEAAGHLILEAGQEAAMAAMAAASIQTYRRILAESVLGPGFPSVLTFVEAILVTRRCPDLLPSVRATFDRLQYEGARAISDPLATRRWHIETSPEIESRNFWMATMGVAGLVANGTRNIDQEIDALVALLSDYSWL